MKEQHWTGRSNISIYQRDCLEAMKEMEDNAFDLAIVDPPYGIGVNVSMGRRKGDKKSDYHKFAGDDVEIPSEDYWKELFRVSINQIVWGGNYMTDYLTPSTCWLMWDKGFSADVTFAQFELAWTSFKSSAKKYNYNAAANRDRIHPTQKPVKLYEWLLMNYANEGDKILDTHLGSGSHAIACWNLNFDLTAFELDADYFKATTRRIEKHTRQIQMF